jgi:translocation and assembly module TamA
MPQKRVAPPRTTARYLLCLLLQLVSLPAFANYRVELSAPDSIRDLLATHLDLMRYRDREDIHADQLDFMVATAPDQVRDLAATEGFFSTTTDVKLDKDGPVPVVRIAVNAGPPTTVSGTDIEVSGPAREQSPAQAQEVIQSWTLRPGAPFRQRDWAAAKDRGLRLLQERRYPAASIADSHAAIHAVQQQAELAVT